MLLQVWVTHPTASSSSEVWGIDVIRVQRNEPNDGKENVKAGHDRAHAGRIVLKTGPTTDSGTAATVPTQRVGLKAQPQHAARPNPTHRTVNHVLHVTLDVRHNKLVHIRLLAEGVAQADDGVEEAHERRRRGLGGERRGVRGDAPAAPGVAGDDDWAWGQGGLGVERKSGAEKGGTEEGEERSGAEPEGERSRESRREGGAGRVTRGGGGAG